MITDSDAARRYLEARKAVRDAKNPMAFLHLGSLYAKGIGTTENHALANYFYEKALAMGCQEAEAYIDKEYALGYRTVLITVTRMLPDTEDAPPETVAKLRKLMEKARINKNFGVLSRLRGYLPLFYPDYDQEKGYDDLINNRDTIDADISYALCTADNWSEIRVNLLDSMLEQLFAPVIQDTDLLQRLFDSNIRSLVSKDEDDLLQCLVNLNASYKALCDTYELERKDILDFGRLDILPFFKPSLIPVFRREIFCCLLSLRGVSPQIDKFLGCLDSDEKLLNLCEEVEDEDLQLFLISFVEYNIDTDSLLLTYRDLWRSCRNHDLAPLSQYFNEFLSKVSDLQIEHQIPEYTSENLPRIIWA